VVALGLVRSAVAGLMSMPYGGALGQMATCMGPKAEVARALASG
jgi:hypothetical protein